MKIGVPKEIKDNENRVGMTPAGVAELVARGHEVFVQQTAGENSGFADEAYVKAGAAMLPTIEETYAAADMIVKVKEPVGPEYALVRPGQVVFTYFHFACDRALTEAMVKSGGVCVAYETVQLADGSLPLLVPMSEVAGRLGMLNGAYYLQKTKGGRGLLACGVPGVEPAHVLVLGGGIVGQAAARVAAGLGATVTIADISLPKLRELSLSMPANVTTLFSSRHNIERELTSCAPARCSLTLPSTRAGASRRPIPPPTATLCTRLTAYSTTPWPTFRAQFPTRPHLPSPMPRCAMPSPWPTRAGSGPAARMPRCASGLTWWKER